LTACVLGDGFCHGQRPGAGSGLISTIRDGFLPFLAAWPGWLWPDFDHTGRGFAIANSLESALACFHHKGRVFAIAHGLERARA
jgi:hypothetical protein